MKLNESFKVTALIFLIVLSGDILLFMIYDIPITVQSIIIAGLIAIVTDFAIDKLNLRKRC